MQSDQERSISNSSIKGDLALNSSSDRLGKTEINAAIESESEDIIWERFKSGSDQALTYIYRNYSNQLFNYGSQFTNDRSLLKDCIQDLFEEIIKRREKLASTSSIKFYLIKSLRNRLVKAINKDKRRKEGESEMNHEGFQVAISAELRLINRQLDEDRKKILEEKLNQLPVLQREALVLYFYEGLKYHQIAELLGIKVKSSRELVYRSIDSLSSLITLHKDELLAISTALIFIKSILK